MDLPARTTRSIKVSATVTIPANTDTTARHSNGQTPLVVVAYQGKTYLVPTTAVRFL